MNKLFSLKVGLICFLLLLLPISVNSEWVYVERVIDGDTFVTSKGEKVRVRNIDTPETNHPYRPKEKGGEEAKKLAVFFLEANFVFLSGNALDKYGRRLAEVKLRGGKRYENIVRQLGYDKRSKNIYSKGSSKKTFYNYYSYSSMDMEEIDGVYYPKSTLSGSTLSPGRKNNYRNVYLPPPQDLPISDEGISVDFIKCGKGKMAVKGYYRKDGTYVGPYCRKK